MKRHIVSITVLIVVLAFCVAVLKGQVNTSHDVVTHQMRYQTNEAEVEISDQQTMIKGAWDNALRIYNDRTYSVIFNSSFTERWYALDVSTLGKSLSFSISCDDESVTGVIASLYLKEDIDEYGNNATRLMNLYSLNKSATYKIKETGTYYIKISIIGNSAVGNELKFGYTLVTNDVYEDNDTWQKAVSITQGKEYDIDISAANDTDWFKITLPKNDQSYQYILKNEIATTSKAQVFVYKEEDLKKYDDSAQNTFYSDEFNKYFTYKSEESTTYYLKIVPPVQGSIMNKITFIADIIEPDAMENNDVFDKAVMLEPDMSKTLTISASNDIDWFMIKTDKPGQTVRLSLINPSTAAQKLNCWWYSNEKIMTYRETASPEYKSSGSGYTYIYLEEASVYYLKIFTEDKSVIKTPIDLSYSIIGADKNEPNNSYSEAHNITSLRETSFTLPALNDEDWFAIDITKSNQAIRIDTSISKTGASVDVSFYSLNDMQSYGEAIPLFSFNSKHAPYIYLLNDPGKYYMKITSDTIISDECTLYYSLIDSDRNEPNNSAEKATILEQGVKTGFTLSGQNDEDWFEIEIQNDGDVLEYIIEAKYNRYAEVQIYSKDELNKYDEYANPLFTSSVYDESITCKFEKAGAYYIKLSSDKPILDITYITYSLSNSDAYENNDTWQDAVLIERNKDIKFTISASNDVDWFKMENKGMNNMSFSYKIPNTFMAKNIIGVFVYREIDLLNYGLRAEPIYSVKTADLSNMFEIEEGTYYFKIVSLSDAAFEYEFTFKANMFYMQQ